MTCEVMRQEQIHRDKSSSLSLYWLNNKNLKMQSAIGA